jgi:putative beta-lysine N-acetyltransferase
MIKQASAKDTKEMAALYRQVFATYPFPIHDPEYLRKTMDNDVVYFGVWHDGMLVALSSCEIHSGISNAEMTDFAAMPDHRGQNLALHLLLCMETELKQRCIGVAYTIARAYSFGMNITFARAGYIFAGTLTNNTNIGGQIESMNVWYKPVSLPDQKESSV